MLLYSSSHHPNWIVPMLFPFIILTESVLGKMTQDGTDSNLRPVFSVPNPYSSWSALSPVIYITKSPETLSSFLCHKPGPPFHSAAPPIEQET